jgi:putative DNA primase/helicase
MEPHPIPIPTPEDDGFLMRMGITQPIAKFQPALDDIAIAVNAVNGEVPTNYQWHFEIGDHVELSKELLRAFAGVVYTEGAFFQYDEKRGVWVSDGVEDKMRKAIMSMSGTALEKGSLRLRASDVNGAIELTKTYTRDAAFFESAASGLACENGFLRVSDAGAELVPHAHEYKARLLYPLAYDPTATAPRFQAFLAGVFRDDEDKDQKIACLSEFCGASLFGMAATYQKCLILPGEGDNGKSTFLTIVSSLFPKGTTAALSPNNFEKEYYRAQLPGVLLNAVAEIPSTNVIASEAFKGVVTGDPMDARDPGGKAFTFRPRAGHIFGANKLPGTSDHTKGFWRRFLVITFNRCFSGDPEKDPEIADKILRHERQGLLTWLVGGAVALRRAEDYTTPISHGLALAAWKKDADTVAMFVEACTEPADVAAGTKSTALYEVYRPWCEECGYKPLAINKFGERLHGLGYDKANHDKVYPLKLTRKSRSTVNERGTRPVPEVAKDRKAPESEAARICGLNN